MRPLRPLTALLALTFVAAPAAAQLIYVDDGAAGANNGTSWTDAYTSVQTALADSAVSGKEIWVAKGTYSPGALQTSTFALFSGLTIRGGFVGNETLLSQRPSPAVGSLLTGDLDGSGSSTPSDCEHVVTIPPGANGILMDGFSVRHGHADLSATVSSGGGILMAGTSSDPIFDVVFDEVKMRENYAATSGGGMYARFASFGMRFCLARKNSALLRGGGIDVRQCFDVNIFSTTFRGNRAKLGGGLAMLSGDGSPRVYSCEFYGNFGNQGGAFYLDSESGVRFGNCTVADNTAYEDSSAIPPAPGHGGGLYLVSTNGAFVYNSIVWGNVRVESGLLQMGSSIEGAGATSATVTYSDIEKNPFAVPPPPAPWPGPGNILADPQFVAASSNNYTLKSTSKCLDSGHDPNTPHLGIPLDFVDLDEDGLTTQELTPYDVTLGNAREFDDPATGSGFDGGAVIPGINDMGCHERQ